MEIVLLYLAVGVLSAVSIALFTDLAAESRAARREREIIQSIIKKESN